MSDQPLFPDFDLIDCFRSNVDISSALTPQDQHSAFVL
jgi:hypothetical protein